MRGPFEWTRTRAPSHDPSEFSETTAQAKPLYERFQATAVVEHVNLDGVAMVWRAPEQQRALGRVRCLRVRKQLFRHVQDRRGRSSRGTEQPFELLPHALCHVEVGRLSLRQLGIVLGL